MGSTEFKANENQTIYKVAIHYIVGSKMFGTICQPAGYYIIHCQIESLMS